MTHTKHDSTDEHRSPGDRRHPSLTDVAVIVGLSVQLAAIVWGASALKSSVDSLRDTMVTMSQQMKETQNTVVDLKVDVSVLKNQVYRK